MARADDIELAEYAAEGILTDGSSILIRAIRADDREGLLDHFHRLSEQSAYFRFFGPKRSLSEAELNRFTRLDYVRNFGLVAMLRDSSGVERIIGVARYMAQGEEQGVPASAEVAFAVDDRYQGRGIGTLLLEHLVRIARANGIEHLSASVMVANRAMLEVFARSGFALAQRSDSGIARVSLSTAETERGLTASLYRERLAAAQSMARLLKPRSVAIVGASRDASKVGGAILANMLQAGFAGAIYPVNPKAAEVQGRAAYASVSAIGAPVEVAIICVPAAQVEAAMRECAAAGVHAVVVISSGFSEVAGSAGREIQQRLLQLARTSGMRLVGPNCMGIINTDPAVRLNATFTPIAPAAGNIGMLSQSGALGIALLDQARRRGFGLSSFVSMGNAGDVSSTDLLAYWSDDPRTAVILLYLESFGSPHKFARLAAATAARKPIVAVKAGRSRAGQRAALSHSASLASLDVALEALFQQCGVVRCDTLEQFCDVAALFSTQPLPAGARVGVVTNAGGPAILLADACEANGLSLPELAPPTIAKLKARLPAAAAFGNPVDMTAAATPEDYQQTIAEVAADPAVDSVVTIYIPPLISDPPGIARGIAAGSAAVPAAKPVLAVFLSSAPVPSEIHQGGRGKLPCYGFPENAALALAATHRYARWRARPGGRTLVAFDDPTKRALREAMEAMVGASQEPRWLRPEEAQSLLRTAGVTLAPWRRTSVENAPADAAELGFPLVAKIISPDVVHKSDVGGVVMGLESVGAVATAVAQMQARMKQLDKRLDGILLQREIPEGIEALVGATDDPTFGKLLVCGLGGVAVEIIRDVAFRVLPITDVDADEMLGALRSRRLLDGFRGAPAGDREALKILLGRVAALVEELPEIVELDLNPVKVLPPGQGVVAIDVRIRMDSAARLRQVAQL